MADKKKNFDFRMSKKVAELTQVVHMLFTRNHEKEVEIEAMKEAYEYEIQLIMEDAEGRIQSLDKKRKFLEEELNRERSQGRLMLEDAVAKEAESKEGEWKQKVLVLEQKVQGQEKLLEEERNACQNFRDLLINAQKDIEKLRQGVAEQLKSKNEEIQQKNNELEKLRKHVFDLEKSQSEQEKQYKEAIKELERTNEKLERELAQLQALLEETHRNKLQLEAKTAKLEMDLRNLKKDFGRKVAEVVASQSKNNQIQHTPPPRTANTNFTSERRCSKDHQKRSSRLSASSNDSCNCTCKQDYNDEVEKLRREVQRYRMELSNRDSNFNRVFTSTTPVVVDPRAGKIGAGVNQVVHSTSSVRTEPLGLGGREKSFSYAFVESIDKSRPTSSRAASASARLPQLTDEQRSRLTKHIVKPRPLPKEMLYGK